VRFRRPAGVIRTWHAWREESKNLGGPIDSCALRDKRKARGWLGTEGETWTQRECLAPKREDRREMTGRRPEPKRQGGPRILGESDQPIVLRERESRSHGEGADGNP